MGFGWVASAHGWVDAEAFRPQEVKWIEGFGLPGCLGRWAQYQHAEINIVLTLYQEDGFGGYDVRANFSDGKLATKAIQRSRYTIISGWSDFTGNTIDTYVHIRADYRKSGTHAHINYDISTIAPIGSNDFCS